MLAAPLDLTEPAHVHHTRLVRPHAMEPPSGAPSGGACEPPLTPVTSYHLDFASMTVAARGAHMTGLQQLSTMCQLLRSVAAATRNVQQGELLMGSVGGVAQVSKYDRTTTLTPFYFLLTRLLTYLLAYLCGAATHARPLARSRHAG